MSTEPSPGGTPSAAPPPPPSGLSGLLRPSTLAPVELDLRLVFLVGIALWAAALVVALVLQLAGVTAGRGVAICSTGVGLGLLALAWERRRRRRAALRAQAATSPAA